MNEREFAISVVRRLRQAGYQALWAGGCVRDELLGLTPKDYDVATDARPEEVRALFKRTVPVGASFGVVMVLGPKVDGEFLQVETATFRTDVYENTEKDDGRHPAGVEYSTPEEDAKRRDFTINGMFFDPLENKLIDYVGGQVDLQARVLRAIGDPHTRFREDKLRLLRGVRMATRFELAVEGATFAAMQDMASQITVVSAERIADELSKLLVHPRRAYGMKLMLDAGLVKPVMPELLPMKKLPQGRPSAPTGDLWDHVMRVLELLGPDVSFPLALATLLHDVGKPRCIGRGPDYYTFYYHEHIGRRMANEIGLRLKLSNFERERVEWLVEKHQILADARRMKMSKLKKLFDHPGIRELLHLHRADALASGKSLDHVEFCEQLLGDYIRPEPYVTGEDLIKIFGLKPGPEFKEILDAVYDAQLEGSVNSHDEALEFVRQMIAAKDEIRTSPPEPPRPDV
jgi:tRNA nucleotidyltransferase/poly(A) polymerase